MQPPGPSSRKVVSHLSKAVPYPVLQENTLVLSNSLVVAQREGKLCLMFRCRPSLPCARQDLLCLESAFTCSMQDWQPACIQQQAC